MSGFGYDETGNTTEIKNPDSSKTLFSYDDADRLTRIEQRNSANVPLAKSEFVYDYASRKAVSLEFTRTNGAWVKTGEKRRVFDGLDVVQERNAGNQVTAQLVRDGNIGGILSRSTAAGATFFGYDGGGNVTLLTDANGDDVGRYRYDAFGNTLEVSGARAAENPYRFSTKELHAASGLYDFGFRFYSPGLGRWINRDPIQEAGGINLYAMVGNDPVNSWDEYGEDAVDEITKALARSHRTITNVEAEIAKRISELREDRLKLPERAPGDVKNPSLSRWGHRMMLNPSCYLCKANEFAATIKCRPAPTQALERRNVVLFVHVRLCRRRSTLNCGCEFIRFA